MIINNLFSVIRKKPSICYVYTYTPRLVILSDIKINGTPQPICGFPGQQGSLWVRGFKFIITLCVCPLVP